MKSTLAVLFVILGLSLWSWLGGGNAPESGDLSRLAVNAASFAEDRESSTLDLNHEALRRQGIESPELIASIPIRDIEVGMRVPALNPQVTDAERAAFDLDIDPATWRKFTLEVEKANGAGTVMVTLLRPSSWLVEESASTALAIFDVAVEDAAAEWEQQPGWFKLIDHAAYQMSSDACLDRVERASPWADLGWQLATSSNAIVGLGNVVSDDLNAAIVTDAELERKLDTAVDNIQLGGGIGSQIWLDMPELGAVGLATVVGNEPCKEPLLGPGQIVTATFVHQSADVLDLTFSSASAPSTQTLGVTATHPFWSVTRDDFIPAGELQLQEEVTTIDGHTWRLTSITSRAGPELVYNFEVAGEHVYYVSSSGMLVHNACAPVPRGIVDDALRHTNKGTRLEGQVANRLFDRLEKFQHVIPNPRGAGNLGDIDVEVAEALIEVTVGKKGKIPQVRKLMTNTTMNPMGKPVIVFAPNFKKHATHSIESIGGFVARTFGELDDILKQLAGL